MKQLDIEKISDEEKKKLIGDEKMEPHNEDVQSPLEEIPWLVRRGSSLLTLTIISIFACCGFFLKYPDVITSSVLLHFANNPTKIVSEVDGEIDLLYARNGKIVARGEVLAVVNSHINNSKINIKSPIKGKVLFLQQQNETHVKKGDVILTIIPIEPDLINATIKVAHADVNKLQVNQILCIQLDDFYSSKPVKLQAKIESISFHQYIDSSKSFYLADVSLLKQGDAKYDSILSVNHTVHGSAMIETKEFSFFQRLIYQLSNNIHKP